MVSSLSITGMVFTLVLTVFLPALLWILFEMKNKGISKLIVAGALGFIISQMIIRIPILQLISSNDTVIRFSENYTYPFILILALSAGLFESAARLIVLKMISKKGLTHARSSAVGYGHGIAEAAGLIGLTYINNIVITVMINTGTLPSNEQFNAVKEIFLNTSSDLFFAAGIERVLSVIVQIGLTVFLAYMVKKNKSVSGFIICTLMHAFIDFTVVSISTATNNVWLSLCVLLVYALCMIVYCLRSVKHFNKTEQMTEQQNS